MPHLVGAAQAILQAILFLRSRQQADGSFEDMSGSVTLHAAALLALAEQPLAESRPLIHGLAQWLLGHVDPKDQHGYFYALLALHTTDPKLLSGELLGSAARELIAMEQMVGGPYIVRQLSRHHSVDIATNSIIARFVSAVAKPLPQLQVFMTSAVHAGRLQSPHYRSELFTIHHMLALPEIPAEQRIGVYIRQQAEQSHSPLQSAWLIEAIHRLRLAYASKQLAQVILDTQAADGSWPAEALCKSKGGDAASSACTTALIVGSLAQLAHYPSNIPEIADRPLATLTGDALYESLWQQLRQEGHKLAPALRKGTLAMASRVRSADSNQEIGLLGYFFARSLATPQAWPDKQFFVHLGLANIYNWMAFTLYDDFYDSIAAPSSLPVANAALHHSLQHFAYALPDAQAYRQLVHTTFDQLDSANAWEIAQCRFVHQGGKIIVPEIPNFGDRLRLAERSFTHMLPVMAVLAQQDIELTSPAARHIVRAGRHYLIARQLNDDMHDWEEDLRAGTISYVLASTLTELNVSAGTYDFEKLFARIRSQFWNHTIMTMCTDLEEHIAAGRQAARASKLLTPDNVFAVLFDSLEKTAVHTRHEHAKAQQFVQAFTQK